MKRKWLLVAMVGLIAGFAGRVDADWDIAITSDPDDSEGAIPVCLNGQIVIEFDGTLTGNTPTSDDDCSVSGGELEWDPNTKKVLVDTSSTGPKTATASVTATFTRTKKRVCADCEDASKTKGKSVKVAVLTYTAGEWTTVNEPQFTYGTQVGTNDYDNTASYDVPISETPMGHPYGGQQGWKSHMRYNGNVEAIGHTETGESNIAECGQTKQITVTYTANVGVSIPNNLGITLSWGAEQEVQDTHTFGGSPVYRYRHTWKIPCLRVVDNRTDWSGWTTDPTGAIWGQVREFPSDTYELGLVRLAGKSVKREMACCAGNPQ